MSSAEDRLRKQAEARLARLDADQLDKLPDDSRELIQELRTHQIELELQNRELRETEAELSAARDSYSDLYNFSPTGYLTLSPKLMIMQANLTLASMLGTDVVHLISSPFSIYVSKEDQDRYYRHHRDVIRTGQKQVVELHLKKADGSCFWANLETTPDAKADGSLLMVVSAIDKRKQAEEMVEAERDRAQSYLDMAGTMFIAVDQHQCVTLANKKACELLGFAEQEIVGKNWFDHFLPQTIREETKAYFERFIKGQTKAVEYFENRVLTRGGSERLIAWHNSTLRSDDGNVIGTLSAGEDITEQRLAEEKSFELIQAIEQAGEALLITDTSGTIEYVNQAFTLTTGYSAKEAVGNNPRMLHSGRQNAAFYKEMWSSINVRGHWQGKIWNKRKNGEVYPERLHISVIKDMDGKPARYCGVFSDISAQVSLEEQLVQAQKMEAVGTLVGGIAHDFNNMLAAITSSLYLVKSDLVALPATVNRVEGVEKQCFRAANLISQLLTFARKDTVRILPFNLTSFVNEAFKLNRVSIPENIRLISDICSERLKIQGDATQMQQVVMNLLVNARDAVAFVEQPSITLKLAPYSADEDFLQRHPEIEGEQFACLSVSDNGYGIPRLNMEHLFEPYFTTKEVGKGSGLGLAMVYGAVQTHMGAVEVESRVNEGSTFSIYLPLTKQKETVQDNGPELAQEGVGETILLVDDEPEVRDTQAEVLESLGYRVIVAGNGREALQLFKEHGSSINLLILDVVMPDMGGVEAAKLMRDINPKIPVIFCTGYDRGEVLVEGDQLNNCIELCKPVPIAEFSRQLRVMLDS